jgi:hypothetical protein
MNPQKILNDVRTLKAHHAAGLELATKLEESLEKQLAAGGRSPVASSRKGRDAQLKAEARAHRERTINNRNKRA